MFQTTDTEQDIQQLEHYLHAADHLVAVVLAGEGSECGLDNTTT
jgi:hypothetical protein